MNNARINILVVDDERGLCAGIQEALRREGYTVEAANDAGGALHWTDTRLFNIVLTDVKMPGLDGLKTAARIKHESPQSRIIIVTSDNQSYFRMMANLTGAAGFVCKEKLFELRALVAKTETSPVPASAANYLHP